MAVVCRKVWGETRLPRRLGHCVAASATAPRSRFSTPDRERRRPPLSGKRGVCGSGSSCTIHAQALGRALPQGDHALLAPLPGDLDVQRGIERNIEPAQAKGFGDAGTRIVQQCQEDTIAPAAPGRSGGSFEDGGNLLARQVAQGRPLQAFHRDGQDPLDNRQRGRVLGRGVFQERPQRRKPRVAGADTVPPLLFQVVQEARDGGRVQISQSESGELLLPARLEVGQQEAEGIAVGRDGLRTGVLLLDQALEEESLNQGRKRRSRCVGVHECFPFAEA